MARDEGRITDGSRVRLALSVVVILLGAVLAVALTPMFDSQVVRSHGELSTVKLGLPEPWLQQDQSSSTPPLPWKARLASVHENPTKVRPAAFAIDFAAALGIEAVGVGLTLFFLRRRDQL